MKKLFATSVMLGCMIFYITAQVINVPVDRPTIQAAIDSASAGDTVLVEEDTYFENINFKGKAITVASRFILDGDTSHISNTIIDGSQPENPDTASVVLMWSGEDTTSVLTGFTITGGTGTYHLSFKEILGGGINILNSGGKITHNIIEGNHVERAGDIFFAGGSVFANVNDKHILILRKNIIRNNSVKGKNISGGGVCAQGGRIICEGNQIINNSANASDWVYGGGLYVGFWNTEGVVGESVIRNNYISGNQAVSEYSGGGGGGYYQAQGYGEENILVYNNIIINNYARGTGGGVFFWEGAQGRFFNNTVVDNTATWAGKGNNISIFETGELSLFNNIIWSYKTSPESEFDYGTDAAKLRIFNNILMAPFGPEAQVTAFNNVFNEPIFQSGSYELTENSPGIGWTFDSLQFDSTWYHAPPIDFNGNPRPHPVDGWIDLGAIESSFPRQVDNANLSHIGLWDRKLWPEFDKDTLQYVLPVPDTTVVTPQIDVVTEDWLAEVNINNAENIGSPEPADRTTTIIVTAADGMTQKTYMVLFRYASKDPTLSYLSISKGTLMPEFQTDSLIYTVCLPKDQTTPPEVYFETNDPMATVSVEYASNIQLQTPWPQYRPYRTTVITVTSEDGIYPAKYEIEHLLDKNVPFIRLASDTVILNSNIEATSTEDGYICLVPLNTSKNTDSVMIHLMDSIRVEAQVAAYLPASDTGTYWLYAIDHCLNISSAVAVTIIDALGDGISLNMSSTVTLYPIPAKQTLYIKTSETILSVELFNVIGVKVMDQSKFEGWIDMGHLEQGVYFIRIRTERGDVYSGKVVKR